MRAQASAMGVPAVCQLRFAAGALPLPHGRGSETFRSLTVAALFVALLAVLILSPGASRADDPDNCLLCHQYRGLSRYDPQQDAVHLYFTSPEYHIRHLGPHARIGCTDCHPREEVAVVPHRPVTPVDCTRQCHLQDMSGLERRFSHADVAEVLQYSVHDVDTLAKLQFTGGPLLRPEQSDCLYCHDEPTFRSPVDVIPTLGFVGAHAFERCDGCHAQQVPIDINYYLRHVAARLAPARPPLEQAQICAVCHSDPRVLADFNLPGAVGSYVRSFHGKAALLGDTTTANCIDCHAAPGQDAHLILAKANPLSSVHPDHVANSCRSVQCHPGAELTIGAAGVHLDLPGSAGALEVIIAAAFIILTIATFGPSLVLCLLELFQIVIGRHHHATHTATNLTYAVLAHPKGRKALTRFTVSQRYQHWLLVIFFAALALTGFPMKFAQEAWSRAVVDFLGGLSVARNIHHWAGIALLIGLVIHLIYALTTAVARLGQPGPNGKPLGLFGVVYNMPMLVRPPDLLKGGHYLLYLLALRRDPPTFGRFTIKEKFEYIGVFWGTVLLGLTGMMLWGEQIFSRFAGGRLLNIALIAHTYEAFLAIIHVGILHIVNVMLSPNVFPLSRATLSGDTPVTELAEQHSEFVQDAAERLGIPATGGGAHG